MAADLNTDIGLNKIVGSSSVPTPQFCFKRDKWVQKVTGGKFDSFTFLEFGPDESAYLSEFIGEELRTLAEDGKPDTLNEKFSSMSPCFFTNSPANTNNRRNIFYGGFGSGGRMEEEENKKKEIGVLEFSTGEYVTNFEGQNIFFVRKEVPGSRHSGTYMAFIEGRNNQKPLTAFVKNLVKKYRKETPHEFIEVYNYGSYGPWQQVLTTKGRPIASVILPKKFKDNIMDDLEEFLSEDTKKWFFEKGIPYKRSYLFYGVPGSGKTSLITALATEKRKPVCYLSPAMPGMTDDALRRAISSAPKGAIIVLEDIDGLFTKDRAKKTQNNLTFSGLLNALDGVGSGVGQMFILTTNFRDKLDQALIRNGRVDLQIKFDYVVAEQVSDMFKFFHEDAPEEACKEFAAVVFEAMKKVSAKPCLTAATLQNYFITHRKCTYQEAIDKVQDLAEDVKAVRDGDDKNVTDMMFT